MAGGHDVNQMPPSVLHVYTDADGGSLTWKPPFSSLLRVRHCLFPPIAKSIPVPGDTWKLKPHSIMGLNRVCSSILYVVGLAVRMQMVYIP